MKDALLAWVLANKLRSIVIVLLAANLLLAAWHVGAFDFIVGESRTQREPQRVLQQFKPETVKVIPAAEAERMLKPTPGPDKPASKPQANTP